MEEEGLSRPGGLDGVTDSPAAGEPQGKATESPVWTEHWNSDVTFFLFGHVE